jgi:hypothetical protein
MSSSRGRVLTLLLAITIVLASFLFVACDDPEYYSNPSVGSGPYQPSSTITGTGCGKGCESSYAPTGVWPEGKHHSNGALWCQCGEWVALPSGGGSMGTQPPLPPATPVNLEPWPAPVESPRPIRRDEGQGFSIDWFKPVDPNQSLGLVFAGTAATWTKAASGGVVLVAADGPLPVGDVVALVVITGTTVWAAVQIGRGLAIHARDIPNWAGTQVLQAKSGTGHLNEGSLGRILQRGEIAAAIAAVASTQSGECWIRPEMGSLIPCSGAVALVFRTHLGEVTFLWNLKDGSYNFLAGNVPRDQLENFEWEPRGSNSIRWIPCHEAGPYCTLQQEVVQHLMRALSAY